MRISISRVVQVLAMVVLDMAISSASFAVQECSCHEGNLLVSGRGYCNLAKITSGCSVGQSCQCRFYDSYCNYQQYTDDNDSCAVNVQDPDETCFTKYSFYVSRRRTCCGCCDRSSSHYFFWNMKFCLMGSSEEGITECEDAIPACETYVVCSCRLCPKKK